MKYLIISFFFLTNVFADIENDIKVLPIDNLKKLSKSEETLFKEYLENLKMDLAYQYKQFKKYPKIAQMRQWQGQVVVKITFHKDKEPTVELVEESKYSVLNDNALKTALNASKNVKVDSKLFQMNNLLDNNQITILLPIYFRLE